MATIVISITNQGRVSSATLNYSVSSTNDTTTVTVTTLVCKSAITFSDVPVSVTCDGTTLYSNNVEYPSMDGKTYTINKTKSFARNTSAASKSLTLTALGMSKSATITVPALASYTVAYNGNGSTGGSTASQTKYYGRSLTLRSNGFTRADFVFTNWNTNSAGSGTSYASGANYTANAAATLYAQWRRIYSNPNVSIMSVQRVDATTHEADDVGTSVAVEIAWSLFDTPSGTNHPTSIVVVCNGVTETLTNLTGLTGTATAYLDAQCYPDLQYPLTVTLTDEGGASRSATAESVVTTPYYPIDIRQGGRGVAIGGPSAEDALDIFMPTKILPRSTSASETPFTINDGTDDALTVDWDGNIMAQAMAGIIQMFAGVTPPIGWLECNGAAVSRETYATLFAAIGTTWGAGDGSTTFNLPDLRGRAPIGAGTGSGLSARTLGNKVGTENAVIPYHTHAIPNHVHTMSHTHPSVSSGRGIGYNYGSITTGVTATRVTPVTTGNHYVPQVANEGVDFSGFANTGASSAANTGNPTSLPNVAYAGTSGNTTGANMQPSAVVKFIICTGKTS